jgi:pyruvyl transferase EpsI
VSERKQAVEEKLREFASAQLVITDRLHGMVFCAITGTPCVVVNSRSPKVLGCYEWIRELPYIHILGEECDLEKIYNAIKQTACCYDNAAMQPLYQQLGEDLTQILFRR